MVFFKKPVRQSAVGHTHILSNQKLTYGIVIFSKKSMYFFDRCHLDVWAHISVERIKITNVEVGIQTQG
jgi:hypothetical protein